MPRATASDESPAQDGWLKRWCKTSSFAERLAGCNELAKRRLTSPHAAEVWLHLIDKAAAFATLDEMESMLRQFILLAPEQPQAAAMFDLLMNQRSIPAVAHKPDRIVFMITSCERYMPQAERVLANLQARGAEAVIVIGDPTLAVAAQTGPLVRLPIADSYEALLPKVLEGLTFLRRRHGPVSIVKIDDDMQFTDRFDPAALAQAARTLDYAGSPIGAYAPDRCWHVGKTSTPIPIFTRRHRGRFAYGPMYVLGPRAVEHLVREWVFYPGEFDGHVYEDRGIGDMLRSAGIELKPMSFAEMGGIVDEEERYVAKPY